MVILNVQPIIEGWFEFRYVICLEYPVYFLHTAQVKVFPLIYYGQGTLEDAYQLQFWCNPFYLTFALRFVSPML